MECKRTVVVEAIAESVMRRLSLMATLVVGVALLIGCTSNRCHRCHSCTRSTCADRDCQQSCATEPQVATNETTYPNLSDIAAEPIEADDLNLSTKPVGRHGSEQTEPADISTDGLYGHGENYEWLLGRMQQVHVPRKAWKVRYAPLDQQDRWGGSVVPAADVRLNEFEDGDFVYIQGEILNDRASLYISGPRYRITSIRHATQEDAQRITESH